MSWVATSPILTRLAVLFVYMSIVVGGKIGMYLQSVTYSVSCQSGLASLRWVAASPFLSRLAVLSAESKELYMAAVAVGLGGKLAFFHTLNL